MQSANEDDIRISMADYRFDTRNADEFKKHIKECSALEKVLMQCYVDYLNSRGSDVYTFVDNGVDNTGDFIEDVKKVSSSPDFILEKNGGRPRKIEIKHCKPKRPIFHIKLPHVKRCIKEDVCIVNWMGVDGESPQFCILTPTILAEALDNREPVKFWHKPCLRFKCSEFDWVHMEITNV